MSDGSSARLGPLTSPCRRGRAAVPLGPAPPTTGRPRRPASTTCADQGARRAVADAHRLRQYTAEIFDEAGIPVLLVGDSAANNVYGYDTTLPVTVDEMLPLVRPSSGATARARRRRPAVRQLPDRPRAGAGHLHPVHEGGRRARGQARGRAPRFAPQVEALAGSGIPVMAHLGFTPQSEHALGGYRVQGRGDAGERLVDDALALQDAGAFAVVLEMVPARRRQAVTGHWPSRRSASAPARTATRRCWSGRTWPG